METKKKYEFTGLTKVVKGVTVHQIRCNGTPEQYAEHEAIRFADTLNKIRKAHICVKYVPDVVGGYIEKEENLSQTGSCWVDKNSVVLGNATVDGDVLVRESFIYGNVKISNTAGVIRSKISDNVIINTAGDIYDSTLHDNVKITGSANVDHSCLSDNVQICGASHIRNIIADDDVVISDDVEVSGIEMGDIIISGNSKITGTTQIRGRSIQINDSCIGGESTIGKRTERRYYINLNDFSGVDVKIGKLGEYTGEMMPKYEILFNENKVVKNEKGRIEETVYRIKAIKDIGEDVKVGDLGGWVADKWCLSQEKNCWIYDDSIALGGARIRGNAIVKGGSTVNVAKVKGNAIISDGSTVDGTNGGVIITGDVTVTGGSKIEGTFSKEIKLSGNFVIDGGATITRSIKRFDNVVITPKKKDEK